MKQLNIESPSIPSSSSPSPNPFPATPTSDQDQKNNGNAVGDKDDVKPPAAGSIRGQHGGTIPSSPFPTMVTAIPITEDTPHLSANVAPTTMGAVPSSPWMTIAASLPDSLDSLVAMVQSQITSGTLAIRNLSSSSSAAAAPWSPRQYAATVMGIHPTDPAQAVYVQLIVYGSAAALSVVSFVYYILPTAALYSLLGILASSYLLGTTLVQQFIPMLHEQILTGRGLENWLPESIYVMLTQTSLHQFLTTPGSSSEYAYLLLYYLPLTPDQLDFYLQRLGSRHRQQLHQPGLGHTLLSPSLMRFIMGEERYRLARANTITATNVERSGPFTTLQAEPGESSSSSPPAPSSNPPPAASSRQRPKLLLSSSSSHDGNDDDDDHSSLGFSIHADDLCGGMSDGQARTMAQSLRLFGTNHTHPISTTTTTNNNNVANYAITPRRPPVGTPTVPPTVMTSLTMTTTASTTILSPMAWMMNSTLHTPFTPDSVDIVTRMGRNSPDQQVAAEENEDDTCQNQNDEMAQEQDVLIDAITTSVYDSIYTPMMTYVNELCWGYVQPILLGAYQYGSRTFLISSGFGFGLRRYLMPWLLLESTRSETPTSHSTMVLSFLRSTVLQTSPRTLARVERVVWYTAAFSGTTAVCAWGLHHWYGMENSSITSTTTTTISTTDTTNMEGHDSESPVTIGHVSPPVTSKKN